MKDFLKKRINDHERILNTVFRKIMTKRWVFIYSSELRRNQGRNARKAEAIYLLFHIEKLKKKT